MNLFSLVKSLKFLHNFSIYENNLVRTSEYFGQLIKKYVVIVWLGWTIAEAEGEVWIQ